MTIRSTASINRIAIESLEGGDNLHDNLPDHFKRHSRYDRYKPQRIWFCLGCVYARPCRESLVDTERGKIMSEAKHSGWQLAFTGLLLAGGLASSVGCQVSVAGQTLPSPYYLTDDVQYFPAGPENKLANETAALKRAQAEAKNRR